MPAIEVTKLEREFPGGIRAVDGVDLEVAAGEIYAFLGPNGAGKTTTVRMLTTLLRPTGGSARVAGHDVVDEAAEVRRSIGVALQEAALDPLMTGRELIQLQATLHGLVGREAVQRGDALIERVGLTQAADRRVGTYSGGMRRRLDLASALVHEPRVLFLDEPTTGLDPVSRKAIWEEVEALNREGTTVFLTTQYLEEADQLADRVGIISGGRIVAEGTPASLKAEVGKPHLELGLADGSAERAKGICGDFGRILPEKEGRLLVELASGASDVAQVVRALDDAGILVESLDLVEPTLDDVFVAKTGEHLEGDSQAEAEPDEAPAVAPASSRGPPGLTTAERGEARGQPARRAGARGALGQADLPAAAARLADPHLPHPAARGPDRRRGRGRQPARVSRGRQLPLLHARRGDAPVVPAGGQHGRHRARGRPRDGVHRPPARGPDLALRDRARPPRRDRRPGRRHGALVHRHRADLRRLVRGWDPGSAADDRLHLARGRRLRRAQRLDRALHRPGLGGPGAVPADLRHPLPLQRLLPDQPAARAGRLDRRVQPALLHRRGDPRAGDRLADGGRTSPRRSARSPSSARSRPRSAPSRCAAGCGWAEPDGAERRHRDGAGADPPRGATRSCGSRAPRSRGCSRRRSSSSA